jgi:hypothetical protein
LEEINGETNNNHKIILDRVNNNKITKEVGEITKVAIIWAIMTIMVGIITKEIIMVGVTTLTTAGRIIQETILLIMDGETILITDGDIHKSIVIYKN